MTEEGRKEKERGQEHTQWGEVGEGEAVCGVSVTCPGGVAWVECAAQGVGGWLGGGGGQVCGVGVLCIGATGGRVGGTGVRVWRAPVGAGGGAGEEREAERHRQAKDNTVCVCVCVCVCVWGGGVVWCGGRGEM